MKRLMILALFLPGLALAAPRDQAVDIAEAKATGWLPAWYDLFDPVWTVENRELLTTYLYVCIEDRQSGRQWTLKLTRNKVRNRAEGRIPIDFNTPKAELTAADTARCHPNPPPPLCETDPSIKASDPACKPTNPDAPGTPGIEDGKASLTWVLPTTFAAPDNNVALPTTGPAALKATRVQYGKCDGLAFTPDTQPRDFVVPVPTTAAGVFNLEVGQRYCFRVRAETNDDRASAWTAFISTVVTEPLGAPTNVIFQPEVR